MPATGQVFCQHGHRPVGGAIVDPDALPGVTQWRQRLLDLGFEIVANTPEQFAAFQAAEFARWQQLITSRNIKAD